LTCFTNEEQAARQSADRQLVIDGVKDFNRRFSGAPRTVSNFPAQQVSGTVLFSSTVNISMTSLF